MSNEGTQDIKTMAKLVDAMPIQRLQNALTVLATYERETDEWIGERLGEAEEEGVELEEDDAYWEAYDSFCQKLYPCLLKEFETTPEEDVIFIMGVFSGDWEDVIALVEDEERRGLMAALLNKI